jgi:hypothetical protein
LMLIVCNVWVGDVVLRDCVRLSNQYWVLLFICASQQRASCFFTSVGVGILLPAGTVPGTWYLVSSSSSVRHDASFYFQKYSLKLQRVTCWKRRKTCSCRTNITHGSIWFWAQEGEDILLRARKCQKERQHTNRTKHYYVLVRRPVKKFETFKFVVSRELNSRGGRTAPKINWLIRSCPLNKKLGAARTPAAAQQRSRTKAKHDTFDSRLS